MYTSLYRHCACSSVNALTFYQPHDHRPYYHLQGLLHDRMTPSDSHLGLFFFIYISLSFIYTADTCLHSKKLLTVRFPRRVLIRDQFPNSGLKACELKLEYKPDL